MQSLKTVLVTLLFSGCLLASDAPFSGTWKFNPSKGHMTPPVPKSMVAHVDVVEQTFKFVEEGVDEKDQPFKISYEAKFDGKDYPVSGDPNADFVALHRVNDHKVKFTLKKMGKVRSREDVAVSKDGQTITVNYTDYVQGKTESGTGVYEKQ